jgi:hypothetical protein
MTKVRFFICSLILGLNYFSFGFRFIFSSDFRFKLP